METIKVGVIANTHGLKGEVKVKSYSGFNEQRYAKGSTLYIDFQNQMIEVKIATYRETNGFVYVCFEGMGHINDIEKYKACDLFVDQNDLHELEEGEVYYRDLVGCEVFDEENNLIGIVNDVLETGANPVLRINETILIPYVKAFIKEVDVKNKKMIVHVIEGLV